jgi:hypothetical protein
LSGCVLAVTRGLLHQDELLVPKREDVEFTSGKLEVRYQLQRMRDGSCQVFVPTKNKESRVIRLGTAPVEAFKAHHVCKPRRKREPTSGLEPLTSSLYE